ncbi:MAG: hypothetical protein QOH93_640 [Chloroflexia bacterium]|jgi:phage tail protein X|nr:hypothetical protein [Chloroflexia bacterium]
MKPISVEYGRVVNLGNYENLRFSVTLQPEEGDTVEAVALEAYRQVHEQIDAVRAAEKATADAEREAKQPWKVTPDMVAEKVSLREKASLAVDLHRSHKGDEVLEKAKRKAQEMLGVDLEFQTDGHGGAIAEVEGFLLQFDGWDYFSVAVRVPGYEEPQHLGSISSLVQLGEHLTKADSLEDMAVEMAF